MQYGISDLLLRLPALADRIDWLVHLAVLVANEVELRLRLDLQQSLRRDYQDDEDDGAEDGHYDADYSELLHLSLVLGQWQSLPDEALAQDERQ